MQQAIKKLAKNLEELRSERGITQVEVADKMEVDKSYISKLEAGKGNPTLNTLDRLAVILNVEVSDLLK